MKQMEHAMRQLEFGWFLPTSGDTTCYGDRSRVVPPSLAMFDRVLAAAEAAAFEYLLVPVDATCWDAYISSAMMLARSQSIRMLVAARPGYINPVLLGKMITAMDQLSGGRVSVNLIAGQSDAEAAAEGVRWTKQQRYELMDEEVAILKALWTHRRAARLRWPLSHAARRPGRATPATETAPALLPGRWLSASLGDLGQACRRAPLLGGPVRTGRGQHADDPRACR